MTVEHIETVIVGGGQAGLAMSYYLTMMVSRSASGDDFWMMRPHMPSI